MNIPDQLVSEIFPFHLLITEDNKIISAGKSMVKLNSNIKTGKKFTDYFDIILPKKLKSPSERPVGQFIIFEKKSYLRFKMQSVKIHENQFLWMGHPVVDDQSSITDFGLTIQDLSQFDALAEYLFLSRSLKKSMAEYKQELQFAQKIIDSSPDGIFILNAKGIIEEVNERAVELLGYAKHECIGKHLRLIIRTEQHKLLDKSLNDSAKHEVVIEKEMTAVKKNGTTFQSEIGINSAEAFGERKYYISLRDISIRYYIKSIESKNKELEEYVYVTSHDMQEPLRSMLGFTDLIRYEVKDTASEELNLYLTKIEKSAHRLLERITLLLDFSRLGSIKIHPVVTNCNKLLAEVMLDLDAKIKEKKAKITIDDLPEMNTDPVLFRLIMQNLLSNAIKFTSDERVPEIHVTCERKDTFYDISVSDNGIGIPEDKFEDIFKLFKRLHHQSRFEGNGVGLSSAKKITELLAGKMSVESTPDAGSTFHVYIPIK